MLPNQNFEVWLTRTEALEDSSLNVDSRNLKITEMHRVVPVGIVELTNNEDLRTTLLSILKIILKKSKK